MGVGAAREGMQATCDGSRSHVEGCVRAEDGEEVGNRAPPAPVREPWSGREDTEQRRIHAPVPDAYLLLRTTRGRSLDGRRSCDAKLLLANHCGSDARVPSHRFPSTEKKLPKSREPTPERGKKKLPKEGRSNSRKRREETPKGVGPEGREWWLLGGGPSVTPLRRTSQEELHASVRRKRGEEAKARETEKVRERRKDRKRRRAIERRTWRVVGRD